MEKPYLVQFASFGTSNAGDRVHHRHMFEDILLYFSSTTIVAVHLETSSSSCFKPMMIYVAVNDLGICTLCTYTTCSSITFQFTSTCQCNDITLRQGFQCKNFC